MHVSFNIAPEFAPDLPNTTVSFVVTTNETQSGDAVIADGMSLEDILLVVGIMGGVLLGLLFLIVMSLIIVTIVMAVRRKRRSKLERLFNCGSSVMRLIPRNRERDSEPLYCLHLL